jgi:glutathione synthase/RimK-type ligase-like ATP-grasp enzyme
VKTVGVIGSTLDQHTHYVADALKRRRAKVVLLETAAIPEAATLSWQQGAVSFQGERLDQVRCFYLRRLQLSTPQPDTSSFADRNFPTWQEQFAAERERQSFLLSVLRGLALGGRHFVNPPQAIDLHLLKLHQLELLQRAKVPVPVTLATCDGEVVRAFHARHQKVIYKPLAGGAHARRLTATDLTPERLELLRNCPALFQAEVEGDEFRAYVLDGEPVAAFQIPTDGPEVDARHNIDRARPAKLPKEGWAAALKAARTLGLVFTGVDLRRDREGRFVVLECNPTPAISFYSDPRTGLLMKRLVSHLLAHA